MKWRIYKEYFNGAGKYEFSDDDNKIKIYVDEHGIFEFNDKQPLPLYAIAATVGDKRDNPY